MQKESRFFLTYWIVGPSPINLAISGATSIQIWSSLYQIKAKRQTYHFHEVHHVKFNHPNHLILIAIRKVVARQSTVMAKNQRWWDKPLEIFASMHL